MSTKFPRIDGASKRFEAEKNYETAAELTKWLMLAVADGMPVTMLRRDVERIGSWLHKGIDEDLLPQAQANFRQGQSTRTAAGYMYWVYYTVDEPDSREEITTALFEMYHWLVQAGRQTHLYFESNHPIGDSI